MNEPRVHYSEPAEWTGPAEAAVIAAVEPVCHARGSCSVMLTGGRSAERLYKAWAALPEFYQLSNVTFYFGDERCVPPDHPDSNYGLAMRTLFQHGVPPACRVIRIEAEQINREAVAAAYEAQLPERLDVLLLSVGEDGHIASLFPHSSALLETCRRVVPARGPIPPVDRITVTPKVIAQAHQIFVMAFGKNKAAIYKQARLAPQDIAALPCRLVLNATWFLDSQSTV